MSKNEDVFDLTYKYSWSKDSESTLDEFLTKYRPSMVQNDGTKPWIWVHGRDEPSLASADQAAAIEEAGSYLKEVTERVESIKNDPAIPTRSNKKTGAKSKKELREQIQAEATTKLKDIAIKHQFVCGKWLIFAAPDRVDGIWRSVATSLVAGPLSETSAFLAKVATSPEDENAHYQHVICIYMPNVCDKDAVTKVMRVLLRSHGLSLNGVKMDLYTCLGIDSKHPSGIQSTVWKNANLMSDSEMKELKEAHFAELSSVKSKVEEAKLTEAKLSTTTTTGGKKPAAAKPGSKLKKKVDDPFASDDDDGDEEEARETEVKAKKSGPAPKRRKAESEDEDSDLNERRKKPRGKK